MLTAALVCRVQGIEWQGFAKAAQQTRLFDDDCAELPQYSDHYTLSPVSQLRCSSTAETNTNLFACICLHLPAQEESTSVREQCTAVYEACVPWAEQVTSMVARSPVVAELQRLQVCGTFA